MTDNPEMLAAELERAQRENAELAKANCALALERERLRARIEQLKTDLRVLSGKHEQALDELAAARLALEALTEQKEMTR